MWRRTGIGVATGTTLLVGHPGESEQAHQSLCQFVTEQQVDHLGVFAFSAEDGTPAAEQPDMVPHDLACQRRDELMALQRDVSRARLRRLRGQVIEVLVDGVSEESDFLLQGRHAGQSPGIDGIVVLADAEAQAGQLLRAEVTETGDYDLVARAVGDGCELKCEVSS